MSKLAPYAKAIIAILGAVLTSVMTQFPDNPEVQTWGPIVAAFLTALAVYAVPNKDPHGTHQDESVQPSIQARPITQSHTDQPAYEPNHARDDRL